MRGVGKALTPPPHHHHHHHHQMLLEAAAGYNLSVDWWTLGLFMSEMLTGRHPFKGENHYTTLRNIVSPHQPPQVTLSLYTATVVAYYDKQP